MLQHATPVPNGVLAESSPTSFIRPSIPYVFAFALGHAATPNTQIPLDKAVTITVSAGTRAPHAPQDWFASRVPVIPSMNGPVRVNGVRRGDMLEIEVVTLEPDGPRSIGPLLVTIAVACGRHGRNEEPIQAMIPAGGAVRIKAQRPGALITFGPVATRQKGDSGSGRDPVGARMIVRCTVVQAKDN